MNALLHDDGRRLSAVSLSGKRRVVWRHPPARVVHVAASPGARRLALSVSLLADGSREPSFALYLLDEDGSVRTVDVVRQFKSIDYPIFLRSPLEWKKAPRLHWVRTGEDIDEKGRLDSQVMVLHRRKAVPVEVPLRYGEAVFALHGYPGAATFTLALFRQNDVPTRLEILKNRDYSESTEASPTFWGDNHFVANTDIFVGVAWLSPTDYVVPVAMEFDLRAYSLHLFRSNCEHLGSHVFYRGSRVDVGFSEAPWPLLPGGRDQVLVLGSRAMARVLSGKSDRAPWLAVEVKTGKVRRTRAVWSRGAWTWVSPEANANPRSGAPCNDLEWTWP